MVKYKSYIKMDKSLLDNTFTIKRTVKGLFNIPMEQFSKDFLAKTNLMDMEK